MVDMHSDTLTGSLQWAGGVMAVRTAPMSELLAEFYGAAFLDKAKDSATAARGFQPPKKLVQGLTFLSQQLERSSVGNLQPCIADSGGVR